MKTSTSTEWLLFHLWKKNPTTMESCPGIFCPDTLIYRWAKPYFWYFTNTKGQIIRKTKESIRVDDIYQKFAESECPQNVAASYLQCQDKQNDTAGEEVVEFEHMEKNDLNFFLYRRQKHMNAILQKFMISKKNHNSVIKVNWSQQFYLINRRTNINRLDQVKIPLNERLSTFEGPEHLLMQDNALSPTITKDIEQICKNIVRHIQDITGGLIIIQRMVLYFKLDDKNRLWFLFCSHIKTKNDQLDSKNKMQTTGQKSPIFQMKKQFKTIQSELSNVVINSGTVESMLNQFPKNCSNCEKEASDLYDVKFQNIVQSFQQNVYKNSMTTLPQEMKDIMDQENNLKKRQSIKYLSDKLIKQQEFEDLRRFIEDEQKKMDYSLHGVPALITKVWGAIDDKKYGKLIYNQSWLELKTRVCDECYLLFTQVDIETDYVREMKEFQEQLKRPAKKEINMFQEEKQEEKEQELQNQKDRLKQNIEKAQQKAMISMKFLNQVKDSSRRSSANLEQNQRTKPVQNNNFRNTTTNLPSLKKLENYQKENHIKNLQNSQIELKNILKNNKQINHKRQNSDNNSQTSNQNMSTTNQTQISYHQYRSKLLSQQQQRKKNQDLLSSEQRNNKQKQNKTQEDFYKKKDNIQESPQKHEQDDQDLQEIEPLSRQSSNKDFYYLRQQLKSSNSSTRSKNTQFYNTFTQNNNNNYNNNNFSMPLDNGSKQQKKKQEYSSTGYMHSSQWVGQISPHRKQVLKGKNNKNLQMFKPNNVYKNKHNVKLPKKYQSNNNNFSLSMNNSISTQDTIINQNNNNNHNKHRVNHNYMMDTIQNMKNVLNEL